MLLVVLLALPSVKTVSRDVRLKCVVRGETLLKLRFDEERRLRRPRGSCKKPVGGQSSLRILQGKARATTSVISITSGVNTDIRGRYIYLSGEEVIEKTWTATKKPGKE